MRLAIPLAVVTLAATLAASGEARADGNLENWLVGPVLGVQLGGHPTSRLVIGFEGGGGLGPERINLGFEHRDTVDAGYIELDPWYIVGGSLGIEAQTDGKLHPVLGVWEGLPLNSGPCTGWHQQLSIAIGYRYTGVHELYITAKAGEMNGEVCFN